VILPYISIIGLLTTDYPYTSQLQELHNCCNLCNGEPRVPKYLRQIITPVNLSFWQVELAKITDQEFAGVIIQGLTRGFRIGFQAESTTLQSSKPNLISSMEHHKIVDDYLASKLASKHLARVGPQNVGSALGIHISPISVIPKKGRVNQ